MKAPLVPLMALFVFAGCATVKTRAADALSCPEDQVEEVPASSDGPEAGRALAQLVMIGSRPSYLGFEPSATLPPTTFKGCGRKVSCDRDGCVQTAHSRASTLSLLVPIRMRESKEAVADATAERTGTYSWQLNSPSRGTSECHIVRGGGYRCDPDFEDPSTPDRGSEPLIPPRAAGSLRGPRRRPRRHGETQAPPFGARACGGVDAVQMIEPDRPTGCRRGFWRTHGQRAAREGVASRPDAQNGRLALARMR